MPRVDRLIGAVPLVSGFLILCFLYLWQAHNHHTPWLFTDELELTQISRAIAETGHAARRGVPYSIHSLSTVLVSPAWLDGNTPTAYAIAKGIGVVVMASVIFPAYGLARLVCRPATALFAALGAAMIPSMAYSSMLLEEPLAYPWATLCLYLGAKSIATRRRRWIVPTLVTAAAAPLVRGQLVAVPMAVVLAALLYAWGSDRFRERRRSWSPWDWVGAAVVAAAALVLASAVVGGYSHEWAVATQDYKGRMVEYGLWAAGALTIGLGVFPVVAGLASLARPKGEQRTRESRALQSISLASLFAFGLYTAIKAAYISTVFATLVEERNLIYVSPLLFAGTGLWLERRRVRLVPLALSAGFALSVILITPYQMDRRLYGDALGLAVLENANRVLAWTPSTARTVLIVFLAISVAVLLVPFALRGGTRRVGAWVAGIVAVLVLAWNLTGQISASNASNAFSSEFLANYPKPYDWVDRAIGNQGFIYLGQNITDANGLWLLEFWNRNLKQMWSLDATAKGPGRTVTPNVLNVRGELTQPPTRYVVAGPGVHLVGKVVATRLILGAGEGDAWQLVRYAPPLRLAYSVVGTSSDGWIVAPGPGIPASNAFTQFDGTRPGVALVTVSRKAWNGSGPSGEVTVRLGTVVIGKDQYPHLGRILQVRRRVIHNGEQVTLQIPAPPPPFRIVTSISPTFRPSAQDPRSSDSRFLGAQVGYVFREAAQR